MLNAKWFLDDEAEKEFQKYKREQILQKKFIMPKALITTVPFGGKNRLPLELLEKAGIEYLVNPLNKKLTEDELADLVMDFDVIIAGTEPITKKVIDRASRLKLISRVGIGLDNIDLLYAKKRGVKNDK